jgi:hypothetical protein
VYSYPPSLHFISNQVNLTVNVLFRNQNISMAAQSVHIYDDNMALLWDSANYSNIVSNNTELVPIVTGPLEWQTWSEPIVSNLQVITSPKPLEQLNITNDETKYLWYRRNITLTQVSSQKSAIVETRHGNSLLFFLDGKYLREVTDCDGRGPSTITTSLDFSSFKINEQYLFEILSISLGCNTGYGENTFDYKGIVGNVSINRQVLSNNETNPWEHQIGLVGEYFQIYTSEGSTKVDWNNDWTKGINKSITLILIIL